MKTLYLVRHAKSSWRHRELRDHERPLKKRGINDANLIATHLMEKLVQPDVLVSSPARRAQQTAKIFAGVLQYPEDQIITNRSIYSSTSHELMAVVLGLSDEYDSAMLFGHDPSLANLASSLTNKVFEKISTSGVVAISFPVDKWEGITYHSGAIQFSIYPKMFV